MTNKKIVGGIIAVFFVAAIIAHLAVDRSSQDAIKIGALYPMTGGLASYGEPARNAAMLAVDDINASGGINGRPLELIVEDHQCDPKTAVSAFNKLVGADGVHIFTSAACTGTVAALVPELQTKDALLLGTITSGNKLTGISPRFFRNWASDGQEAKLLADEATRKGYKHIAVIYEETDYAKGLKLSLENDLKDTDVKIISESFASGATDVRSQLTKLQAFKPDLVFVSVQTVPSGELVLTQMEQLKFKPAAMFVNDNVLKSRQLLANHAALLEGAIGGDYVFAETPELKVVLEKYKARYGADCPQVNICAAEYDAIQLLAQALKAKGDVASGVASYLKSADYEGVSGAVSFDANNDRSDANYSLFKIKAGKAEVMR